jgi:sugar lactone lactonase YvrE
MKQSHSIVILFIAIGVYFSSCAKKGDSNPNPQNNTPTITSLSVSQGPYNTSVIITGTNFSPAATNDQVFFNGKVATVIAATSTQLTVAVPLKAGTGNVTVSINNSTPVSGPVFTYQSSVIVTTLAGSGIVGSVNGSGATASFSGPWGVAVDASGNVYISDFVARLIRKITSSGVVSTFAGGGTGLGTDGKGTASSFAAPAGIAIDAIGNLFVADVQSIREIAPDGTVKTVKGSINSSAYYVSVAVDITGNLYAADLQNRLIHKISQSGISTVFAGSGVAGSFDGTGTSASFYEPIGLSIDVHNNLFVVDEGTNLVRKITSAGVVSTIAGSGSRGSTNGIGTAASFNNSTGIVVDVTGNLYIGDYGNYVVRKIAIDGTVSTFAGSGIAGSTDGLDKLASFNGPQGIAIDAQGDMYLADGLLIRKIMFQ